MNDITRWIPIFSGLLIFIGYFNYHSYYTQFDIEIWSYLTTSELLLSFLPLTIPILTIIALLFFHAVGELINLSFKKDSGGYDDDSNILTLYLFKDTLVSIINKLEKKEYKKWKILWLVLDTFSLIFGAIQIIFFVAYISILLIMLFSDSALLVPSVLMIVFSLLWIILLIDIAERAYNNNSLRSLETIKLIFIVPIFLALIWLSNKDKAFDIKNGNPKYDVCFTTNMNEIIRSDSTLIFVGKTSNYLFLRNINMEQNIIYSLNGIEKIDIKKHID